MSRIEMALGGTDDPTNLYPSCGPCNRDKWNRPLDSWLATRPTPPPSAALDAALAYARRATP